MKHSYYYGLISKCLRFIIPEHKDMLIYGCHNLSVIRSLNPLKAHCIGEEEFIIFEELPPHITVENAIYQDYEPQRKYDYVVLDVALGKTDDIPKLLNNVLKACTSQTRIVIHQENLIWRPILVFTALIGLKNKEHTRNWLSQGDLKNYLKAMGFDVTRTYRRTLFPMKLLFFGPVINFTGAVLPFFDFLKLDQFITSRRITRAGDETVRDNPSLSICLTVRDEGSNIEPIVKSIPLICENQEILFVEGHSTDNTVEEIKRMQKEHPDKNVRLLHQSGIGQGDAIKLGFSRAMGDVIILYEGDGTSDPEDIRHFYDCMRDNRYEFIEGSRFSYPFVADSMPLINRIGNVIFAKWFSLFLRQESTDILSGIKAITKPNFELINNSWGFLRINDPFGDFELLFGSARYGLKIGEIPIHYRPRGYGSSKTRVFKHGFLLVKLALKGYFSFRNSKI